MLKDHWVQRSNRSGKILSKKQIDQVASENNQSNSSFRWLKLKKKISSFSIY